MLKRIIVTALLGGSLMIVAPTAAQADKDGKHERKEAARTGGRAARTATAARTAGTGTTTAVRGPPGPGRRPGPAPRPLALPPP